MESSKFQCQNCANKAIYEWTMADVMERGTPICPDCGDDMILLETQEDFTLLSISREDIKSLHEGSEDKEQWSAFVDTLTNEEMHRILGIIRTALMEQAYWDYLSSAVDVVKNER